MFSRFLLIGAAGFTIDAGLTELLIRSGTHALIARPPALIAAMLATWLLNRSFTYRVATRRSAVEALRYSLVAALVAGLNYVAYSIIITLGVSPFVAIAIASAAQAVISYFAYRRFVFRVRTSRRG